MLHCLDTNAAVLCTCLMQLTAFHEKPSQAVFTTSLLPHVNPPLLQLHPLLILIRDLDQASKLSSSTLDSP